MILSPNSMTYKEWQRPSIPIYTQIYIFNVTNCDDILGKHQSPVLQELGKHKKNYNKITQYLLISGPYTFRETYEKVNISWNDNNGTVTYKQIKRWHFVPEMTNGSLDDQISHLNVPMIVSQYYMSILFI